MRQKQLVALCSALMLLGVAACEAEDVPETMEPPIAEATPAAAPPTEAPVTAAAALNVARTPEYGPHLTDASGRALYLLEGDTAGSGLCDLACAAVWPPLVVAHDAPIAGDTAVRAALIGTIERPDGEMQVTYDGHPLYYYNRDQGPGQALGQDMTDRWGEWYLVTPAGEPLGHAEGGGGS